MIRVGKSLQTRLCENSLIPFLLLPLLLLRYLRLASASVALLRQMKYHGTAYKPPVSRLALLLPYDHVEALRWGESLLQHARNPRELPQNILLAANLGIRIQLQSF